MNIIKISKVVTKIAEVFHWVGAVLMTAAVICSLAAPDMVKYFVGVTPIEGYGVELNIYGFEVLAPIENGTMDMKTFFLFGIGGVIILILMALVFRNLNKVMKHAEAGNPFHKENAALLKQVGFFSLAIPVVGLVMSTVCRLVLGVDNVEAGVNLYGFCMGIIVLSLTQFFVHGSELEEDVEGLL